METFQSATNLSSPGQHRVELDSKESCQLTGPPYQVQLIDHLHVTSHSSCIVLYGPPSYNKKETYEEFYHKTN